MKMDSELSHVDADGTASMVDVSGKPDQLRTARARGRITVSADTAERIAANTMKKGDVLTVAEIAGIQAAKKTSELIPLCHPLRIDSVEVTAVLENDAVTVTGRAVCVDRTGVEMEALTAVSVALLTVYDMCKAVDSSMVIGDIRLVSKKKRN